MKTLRLHAPLAGTAAFFAVCLLLGAQPPARAQAGDPAAKLDPVLQDLSQRAGRSRVIVEFAGSPDPGVITARQGRLGRRLDGLRAQVAEIDNATLPALAADPRVARISVDREVFPTLSRTGPATGATAVRQQTGLTGRGVGVAVIDSGISSWPNDLHLADGITWTDSRVVHFADFTADAPLAGPMTDEFGHGTHVAGTIAGSGFDSDGARMGMAPGAHLVVFRVLDADGRGYISDVIAAIDDAIARKNDFNIRIINLSVASGVTESFWTDPLTLAARRAVDAGIVVVAAAGNLGQSEDGHLQYGGITAPGNAPWVLTVGAATHQGTTPRSDDAVAGFSSRGPTWFDFAAKPDLVAPGVGIESTIDPNSTLALTYPDYLLDGTQDVRYKPYLSLSGTSMATPVVSGAVALMLEASPALTPNAVKAILQYTAQVIDGESPLAQGAGLLNVAGAVRLAQFFADPDTAMDTAADVIEGELVPWSQRIIWGNHQMSGGVPLPGVNAWDAGVTWGARTAGPGEPVVWGIRAEDAASAAGFRTNIVWATSFRNIVWATGFRNNIVWATSFRNIVWATGFRNNIVWATTTADNVVWGDDCGGSDCGGVLWGTEQNDGTLWGTCTTADNVIWAASTRRNIVWATAEPYQNVRASAGLRNIVWATGGGDVWASGALRNIVWATGALRNIVWATGGVYDPWTVWTGEAPPLVVWPGGDQ